MRKIEEKMIDAIQFGKNWTLSNTHVELEQNPNVENTIKVYLHGNLIACFFPKRKTVKVCDGGWQSNTTKSHLNALLGYFTKDYGIFQKNWVWYLKGNAETVEFKNDAELPTKVY